MTLHCLQGELFPRFPFDFSKSLDLVAKSLDLVGMFAPSEGNRRVSDLSFTRAIYLENQTLAFRLKEESAGSKPVLSYTLYSYEEISEEVNYPSLLPAEARKGLEREPLLTRSP